MCCYLNISFWYGAAWYKTWYVAMYENEILIKFWSVSFRHFRVKFEKKMSPWIHKSMTPRVESLWVHESSPGFVLCKLHPWKYQNYWINSILKFIAVTWLSCSMPTNFKAFHVQIDFHPKFPWRPSPGAILKIWRATIGYYPQNIDITVV